MQRNWMYRRYSNDIVEVGTAQDHATRRPTDVKLANEKDNVLLAQTPVDSRMAAGLPADRRAEGLQRPDWNLYTGAGQLASPLQTLRALHTVRCAREGTTQAKMDRR